MSIAASIAAAQEAISIYQKANGFYERKEYRSSLIFTTQLLNTYPNHFDGIVLYYNLGCRFNYLDSLIIAEQIFNHIINKYPDYWVASSSLWQLGEISLKRGDTISGIRKLKSFVGEPVARGKALVSMYDGKLYSGSMDKYDAACLLTDVMIKRQEYVEALSFYIYSDSVIEQSFRSETCGTPYDAEKGLSRQRGYEIYLALKDTVRALGCILDEALYPMNHRCYSPTQLTFQTARLKRLLTEAQIRDEVINSVERVYLERTANGVYRTCVTVFGDSICFYTISPQGVIGSRAKDDLENSGKELSQSELLAIVRDYYRKSCFYQTLTGQI